jgi:hypothetical protein
VKIGLWTVFSLEDVLNERDLRPELKQNAQQIFTWSGFRVPCKCTVPCCVVQALWLDERLMIERGSHFIVTVPYVSHGLHDICSIHVRCASVLWVFSRPSQARWYCGNRRLIVLTRFWQEQRIFHRILRFSSIPCLWKKSWQPGI